MMAQAKMVRSTMCYREHLPSLSGEIAEITLFLPVTDKGAVAGFASVLVEC